MLYGLLLGETTTFPIGLSAGGFTWVFDSNLRVPVRRSRSFGPMFAERPFTTGKARLNVGATFQHTTFSSVGGQPLSDIEDSSSYGFGDEIEALVDAERDRKRAEGQPHVQKYPPWQGVQQCPATTEPPRYFQSLSQRMFSQVMLPCTPLTPCGTVAGMNSTSPALIVCDCPPTIFPF